LVSALTTVAALLLLAHLGLLMVTLATGHDYIFGLVALFDLNRENNVPSFFSGGLFLLNGLLIWLVGQLQAQRRRSTVWYALAVVFVLLSYDELFGLHELLTIPLREALGTTGLLYYPWMIVYVVPLLALITWFFPAWRALDAGARSRMMVAAALYLFGAIVMEMLGGAYDEAFGPQRTLGWGLLVAVEESLEMAGLIVFAHALLLLLRPSAGGAPLMVDDVISAAGERSRADQ
jgi:hypothetical protein